MGSRWSLFAKQTRNDFQPPVTLPSPHNGCAFPPAMLCAEFSITVLTCHCCLSQLLPHYCTSIWFGQEERNIGSWYRSRLVPARRTRTHRCSWSAATTARGNQLEVYIFNGRRCHPLNLHRAQQATPSTQAGTVWGTSETCSSMPKASRCKPL